MLLREKYLANVEKLIDKIENLNYEVTNKKLLSIKKELQRQEIIVPIIGNFSSGKSAFLNMFIDKNVLKTNITAETSLATELRYTEDKEMVEAIRMDGSIDSFELSDINKTIENASEYKYLKCYINSYELKKIAPIVLVDMPGFNSTNEGHNKAILEYLNKGVYYILLTSIEAGTINASILRELENIVQFNKDFSVVLSKVDLRRDDVVNEVSTQIHNTIYEELDLNKLVYKLSKDDRNKALDIINNIDINLIVKNRYKAAILEVYEELEDNININIDSLFMDVLKSKEEIKSIENSIKSILNKRDDSIRDIKNKYSYINYNSILSKIDNEVKAFKDSLVSIAINQGSEELSQRLSDIMRTTLVTEIDFLIENISKDIAVDFSTDITTLNNSIIKPEIVEKIKDTSLHYSKRLKSGFDSYRDNLSKNISRAKGAYKAATTTLAITTSIVAPILEIAIVFLPDILDIFIKKAQENKQRQEVGNKIIYEILPQMKDKVREQLKDSIYSALEETITNISNSFEDSLQEKKEILEQSILNNSESEEINKQKELELKEILKEIENLKDDING